MSDPKKRRVGVAIPITGQVYVELDVDEDLGDEEIFSEACDAYVDGVSELEWEFTQHVSSGNVCHAMLNSFDIQDVEP